MFKTKLDAMTKQKVEQIVNAMLNREANEIANATRYEKNDDRKAYRASHYELNIFGHCPCKLVTE